MLWEPSYCNCACAATAFQATAAHHGDSPLKEHVMKSTIHSVQIAALWASLAAGGVMAQTAAPAAPDVGPSRVVTDVAPAPAQERDSMGAIVLENSLVRAQQQNAFEKSAARTGVATVGRNVMRATMNAQREADLAQARQDETMQLHQRGAGSLVDK
jgi:hypothetical protein